MASSSTRPRIKPPGLGGPRPGQVVWWVAGCVLAVAAVVAQAILR